MATTLRPATSGCRLADIADRCGLVLADPGDGDVVVRGVTHDSRSVQPGDLFAALPGERAHGLRFGAQARSRGAVAILSDVSSLDTGETAEGLPLLLAADVRGHLGRVASLVYGEPSRDLVLVGVTGTNGKTTTAFLLQAGLRAAGLRAGIIGTTGARLDDESLPLERTTPEAPDLQALLAVMRERGIQAVAMEVSSHALALHRVDGIVFQAAIFTNLSQDHLDFHGTMESYYDAKASLFDSSRARVGVVCVDDAWGRRLAREASIPVTTYAIDTDADVACTSIRETLHGQVVSVRAGQSHADIALSLPGTFNAANGVAAWTTLRLLGLPEEDVARGLAQVTVPGRMQIVDRGQPFLAIVDYAHSPDSVERAILAVRGHGRVIVVLGCGGDRDRDKRPIMGRIAAELADLLIVTDDNPRSESPAQIRAEMLAGVPADAAVVEIGDRRAAIRHAVEEAGDGDVVLLLGKGHEPGQEVAGAIEPFLDADELAAAIEVTR